MVEFQNLVVFMSDGLRWDYLPQAVRDEGVTFRTIASSLHTPTSIASMLTGRYLPNHGVRGFTDTLAGGPPTVLDAFAHAGVSAETGDFNQEIYGYLLDGYDRIPLADIEESFAWFVRDPGGHAPLDGFDDELRTTETVRSYLRRHGGDDGRIQSDYERAIDASVERFFDRVWRVLEERGILDDTLIVFTSDHGELLGEYGHVGESHPACPELVCVPTTFIHPDLPTGENSTLMRHVDLFSSIRGLGTIEAAVMDGTSVFDSDNSTRLGLNFYDRPYPSFRGTFHYSVGSVWDWAGGHVFNWSSLWNRLKLVGGYLTKIPAGIHLRRSLNPDSVRLLLKSYYSLGEPGFDKAEALAALKDWSLAVREPPLDINADTERHLEDLGYL